MASITQIWRWFGILAVTGSSAFGCNSTLEREVNELLKSVESARVSANQDWHRGPGVALGESGPARFVPQLMEAFQPERAMGTVTYLDQFYRAPANDGYDASLDHIAKKLEAAGFGGDDPRFELRFIEQERLTHAWTPLRGSITLSAPGEQERVLHQFEESGDADRCMLPVNSPSCDVEGYIAMDLDHLEEGFILVTDVPTRQVYRRATSRGAAAVVSASLGTFNVDPSGKERHLDAIQYRQLAPDSELPAVQISQRSYAAIRAAYEKSPSARLAIRASVRFDDRPLRTLVATIVGDEKPDEAIVVVSHVQEPGACDNATGVAGLVEGAINTADLLRAGEMDWPARTLVFLSGDEFRQSRAWLDETKRRPVAAISSDMTGQSRERTGAIALLERMPDPGALVPLPPDEHTPWGAGEVEASALTPHGINVIARCAMVDVGVTDGGWDCADHPWEGGSDHDVFIDRGVPAVLMWHFTDFAYHTSLDRIDMVDPAELRRTTAAIFATALAVADPQPGDLDRYVESVAIERRVRVEAAEWEDNPALVELWNDWCRDVRHSLRALCLDLDPAEAAATEDGE